MVKSKRLLITTASAILIFTTLFFMPKFAQRANEEALKRDLRTMREAIDDFTTEKHKPPQSLEDLVRADYIQEIPVDPVCHQEWNLSFGESVLDERKTIGLDNVSSACVKVGSNGSPYNAW